MSNKRISNNSSVGVSRTQKAKLNISTSLLAQVVSMLCGLIVPRLMLETFGSELYGATTSITSFLAYISLIEGGVAGVARAALYKPLANSDLQEISGIYNESKHFFRIVGGIFVLYTIALACGYNSLAKDIELDRWFSASLVLAISVSTLAQYMFGISNVILVQAEQKNYIINILSITTVLINTLFIILLTRFGCNIIIVKLVSSCIFIIRPVVLTIYVKKHYKLFTSRECHKTGALNQKWTALGQHIAFFLHTNTDVVVLTILADLKTVAVYSVYNMVISNIRSLVASSYNGLESIFGNMYAKGETDHLDRVFGYYETFISIVAISLFSTTAAMIVPFVKLYTIGITDVNYIIPLFAIVAVLAELVFILRTPYHYLVNAANRFKQTKYAAYGEAIINMVLSVVLVFQYGIVGVAIATLLAMMFRSIYYSIYISKHIIHRKITLYIKRNIINFGTFGIIVLVGNAILSRVSTNNYLSWALCGFLVLLIAAAITLLSNCLFYREDVISILKRTKMPLHLLNRKQ